MTREDHLKTGRRTGPGRRANGERPIRSWVWLVEIKR